MLLGLIWEKMFYNVLWDFNWFCGSVEILDFLKWAMPKLSEKTCYL